MDAGQDKLRAETSLARRRDVQRRRLAGERVQESPQIGENLVGHPRAHPAGINEFAAIAVVGKQQRPEMGISRGATARQFCELTLPSPLSQSLTSARLFAPSSSAVVMAAG